MKLAIFDIDGTLTNTNTVDGECFVEAFADVHGVTGINTDWSDYPHTTDSGITLRIFQERWGRAPETSEISKLKQHFATLLRSQLATNPALFAEIPGASAMFDRLRRETAWAVAIATGCWSESADLKLEAAGIHADGVPIACADDSLSREEILQAAVLKALERYGQKNFERIVSIGDGVWDVRTALHLNFAFLGIASPERETRLRTAGATHVIENYTDFDQVMRALNEASIPQQIRY